MSEATKNTLKDLAKILGGFGAIVALIYIIPNGSIAQHILAALFVAALLIAILIFTPLGNPIKRLIKKFKKKEGENK